MLAEAQAENGNAKPGQPVDRQGTREWSKVLRALMQSFETNHTGWTRARKRDSLTTLLNSMPRDPDTLLARLRALISGWEETAAARTPIETSDGVADQAHRPGGIVVGNRVERLIQIFA